MTTPQNILVLKPVSTGVYESQGNHFAPKTILRMPNHQRQEARLQPKFEVLRTYIEEHNITLQQGADDIDPSRVLVFEVCEGIGGIARAIEKIEGFTFLLDEAIDSDEADEDFYYEDKNTKERVSQNIPMCLYATLTNRRAAEQLVSLWKSYTRGEKYKWGYAKFWGLFSHLKDIHFWGEKDRVRNTCIQQYVQEKINNKVEKITFEIELWYYADDYKARVEQNKMQELVQELGGRVENSCRYPQIAYHAMAVTLPTSRLNEIINREGAQLITEESIKFLKPLGQVVAPYMNADNTSNSLQVAKEESSPIYDKPLCALLDGMPIENHNAYSNYLMIDDPDGFGGDYPSTSRIHGTAMASLIVRGDLASHEAPINRPLYVRPIMRPKKEEEYVPEACLFPDMLYKSITRIKSLPECSNIRVINLSIGDCMKTYSNTMSPEAKMIDWLSAEYNIVFVVSAGNHPYVMELPCDRVAFNRMLEEEKIRMVYDCHFRYLRQMMLLAPAESINNLTIGALNKDASNVIVNGDEKYEVPLGMPALYSALGFGANRSIKPDCVLSGGRQVYRGMETAAKYRLAQQALSGPGQIVASNNYISQVKYTYGTSNATALASKYMHDVYDVLQSIDKLGLPEDYEAIAIKGLFIHSCQWEHLGLRLKEIIPHRRGKWREDVLKMIGYGEPDIRSIQTSTDERVVFVGCGAIFQNSQIEYRIPLPMSIVAQNVRKRLTITLSWVTPLINGKRRNSVLFFTPSGTTYIGVRSNSDMYTSQRGTIQHEVFEGDNAASFVEGTDIVVSIIRKKSTDTQPTKFFIAVTIEVAEGCGIQIYQEIAAKVAAQTTVPVTL